MAINICPSAQQQPSTFVAFRCTFISFAATFASSIRCAVDGMLRNCCAHVAAAKSVARAGSLEKQVKQHGHPYDFLCWLLDSWFYLIRSAAYIESIIKWLQVDAELNAFVRITFAFTIAVFLVRLAPWSSAQDQIPHGLENGSILSLWHGKRESIWASKLYSELSICRKTVRDALYCECSRSNIQ